MEKTEFKVGDVVRLKSGGPSMTVCRVTENHAFAIFFYNGQLTENAFLKETLASAEAKDVLNIEGGITLTDTSGVLVGYLEKQKPKHEKTSG